MSKGKDKKKGRRWIPVAFGRWEKPRPARPGWYWKADWQEGDDFWHVHEVFLACASTGTREDADELWWSVPVFVIPASPMPPAPKGAP